MTVRVVGGLFTLAAVRSSGSAGRSVRVVGRVVAHNMHDEWHGGMHRQGSVVLGKHDVVQLQITMHLK